MKYSIEIELDKEISKDKMKKLIRLIQEDMIDLEFTYLNILAFHEKNGENLYFFKQD